MTKQILALTSVTALAACAIAVASTNRTVGVIASVEGKSPVLKLTSRGADATTVRTDEKTAFMKWVTHKPWEADGRLSTSALMLGRCVEIEMRVDNAVAKVVRVSDEPAGSVFDPCRDRRELR
ncbi:MAG TPA: hypothetical protein VLV86_05805 [Vicinamibacterales bacterium]|nr:hypothetical protein [Vicinamibacterales bacterium]